MKRNKFIYMLIFSLVFLGFTSGVKAGCCYGIPQGKGIKYQYDGSVPDDKCTQAFSVSYNPVVLDEATCLAQNKQDIVSHDMTDCSSDMTENTCRDKLHGTMGTDNCCHYSSQTEAPTSLPSTITNSNGNNNDNNTENNGNNNNNSSDPDGNRSGNGSTTATSGTTGSDTITVGFDCNDPSVAGIVSTIKTIYNLLRYATPVILIILGSVDFLKAVVAAKEDEIEKNKKRFINRLLLAVMIFLLLSVFQLVTNILGSSGANESNSWIDCWNK